MGLLRDIFASCSCACKAAEFECDDVEEEEEEAHEGSEKWRTGVTIIDEALVDNGASSRRRRAPDLRRVGVEERSIS